MDRATRRKMKLKDKIKRLLPKINYAEDKHDDDKRPKEKQGAINLRKEYYEGKLDEDGGDGLS